MALKSIKDIIQNKGYFVNQKDRQIFETGDLRSFFGFSQNDAIEFIIYDSNDNALPQINGELVRYIPLSTQNINDYFLIPEGTIFQKYNLPKEYFIDAERLLREAGYNNGVFKTQITLINKRVGSEFSGDKLWISEISPSRTEIRLFPLKKNQSPEVIKNLDERFKAFTNNQKFREDIIQQAFVYIEQINPSEVGGFLKSKYGDDFFATLVDEYKIQSFDTFITDIHKRFIEACIYEFSNRISDVNDLNYGKAKKTKPKNFLTQSEIQRSIRGILVSVLNKFMFEPDVRKNVIFDNTLEQSLDPISKIIQTEKSDTKIGGDEPVVTKKIGIVNKPVEKDSFIKLKEKIKIQIPKEPEMPPPSIVLPIDEPIYIEQPPVIVDLPPIIKQPIDGVFVNPNPTPIRGGGGGGGTRGGISNVRNEFGIDLNELFDRSQIQNIE